METAARARPPLLRTCQRFVEKRLGLRIYRHPPLGRYFYPQLPALRAWSADDVVFDVGANDGRTVIELQRHLPSPRIYAFEPVARTFRELTERTRHLDNVRRFHLALGDETGERDIYLHDDSVMNSFSPVGIPVHGTESVAVTTIDNVMADHGVAFIHFLKLDTEGHELAVLRGARSALNAARIAILQVEVGFDQMERSFCDLEEVRRFLAPMGYYLYGVFNQCTRTTQPPPALPAEHAAGYKPRVLAYCDAVFLSASL